MITDQQRYDEYFTLAGVLSEATLEAAIKDLDGRGGLYETARRALSDRLDTRRRSIANARKHGWIK